MTLWPGIAHGAIEYRRNTFHLQKGGLNAPSSVWLLLLSAAEFSNVWPKHFTQNVLGNKNRDSAWCQQDDLYFT